MKRAVVALGEPATTVITGIALNVYADRYRDAAIACLRGSHASRGFDPVPYQLFCQSLELHLKSFLWLKLNLGDNTLKIKYGHNLERLWRDAKAHGVSRYATPTKQRDECIRIIGPYYLNRKLAYLDVDMVATGYSTIRAQPRILETLNRFTRRLGDSLRAPIMAASRT